MKSVTKNVSLNPGDTAPMTDRLASSAHEAIDDAAERTAPIEKQIRATAVQVGEQLETSKSQALEQLDHSLDRLQSFVKGRPVAAAGIAFAAGVVITTLMRR